MDGDTPKLDEVTGATPAVRGPESPQQASDRPFPPQQSGFFPGVEASAPDQRTYRSVVYEWLPERPSVKRVRAALQHLDSLIVAAARSSRDRAQIDHRLAQLAWTRAEVLGLLETAKSNGGRARAASAIRRPDGTFLGYEEIEELAIKEYERYARGGRARAARAARRFDGTFASDTFIMGESEI